MLKIDVKTSDVRDAKCDVLVLKYAQALYGADFVVANAIAGIREADKWAKVDPHEHLILDSLGLIPATRILVVGVVPLNAFEYSEIRSFAKQAIKLISRELPEARHIAMTIHGVGTGLDERESFLAQLGGSRKLFRIPRQSFTSPS